MAIDLDTARSILAVARSHAAAHDLAPIAVVVLDAGGSLLAAEREDGSSSKRYEIAHAKAHGAVSLGMGSRALMARAEQQPYFVVTAAAAIGGSLIPVPGGVLVQDSTGTTVGAVGVSGDSSDNDEAAAIAGIVYSGLSFSP